jgi:hypothetical protein
MKRYMLVEWTRSATGYYNTETGEWGGYHDATKFANLDEAKAIARVNKKNASVIDAINHKLVWRNGKAEYHPLSGLPTHG